MCTVKIQKLLYIFLLENNFPWIKCRKAPQKDAKKVPKSSIDYILATHARRKLSIGQENSSFIINRFVPTLSFYYVIPLCGFLVKSIANFLMLGLNDPNTCTYKLFWCFIFPLFSTKLFKSFYTSSRDKVKKIQRTNKIRLISYMTYVLSVS